jgi:putative heme iron utilization protein
MNDQREAEGKVSGDYYNVMARKGFHGHLRHQRCSAIAFVQRPFMDAHRRLSHFSTRMAQSCSRCLSDETRRAN